MKAKFIAAALVASCAVTAAFAQQVPIAAKASEVTPAASGMLMQPEYAKAIGRVANIWGWPLFNQMNHRTAITQSLQPGRLNDVLLATSRGQIIRF